MAEISAWQEEDMLMLSVGNDENALSVYAFALKAIKELRIFYHGIPLDSWTKGYNKEYRRFGLVSGNYGSWGLKLCSALEIIDREERFLLLVPAYEMAALGDLLGLDVPALPTRADLRKASAANKGSIRPQFYWRIPEGADWKRWFRQNSDMEFNAEHPKAYMILSFSAIAALVLPCVLYGILASNAPGINMDLRGIGIAGAFVFGLGIMDIIAAWIKQYFGHWFTLIMFAVGTLLMAIPFYI